jgi:prepilin-type N-terminal cleavage/methylation domain-containing protein
MPFSRADAEMEMTSRPSRAFTLIELLVVVVILAVLAGLAFPVFQSVQNSARKTQARNDVTQIVTAVNAFYTEYGKYPLVTEDKIYGPAGDSNDAVLNVLRAKNLTENPRQIIFISPPDVKTPTKPQAGIGTDAGTLGQYFDPWGTAYRISIDGNYDNQLANPYSSNAGSPTLQAGVIAWSFGKDTDSEAVAADKNSLKNKDDVISWQ